MSHLFSKIMRQLKKNLSNKYITNLRQGDQIEFYESHLVSLYFIILEYVKL